MSTFHGVVTCGYCGGISQPVSRVVAGPEQDEPAPASSFIADVAAFRALTPEQRAALLLIGADGPALLDAARRLTAEDEGFFALRNAVARIDARRP